MSKFTTSFLVVIALFIGSAQAQTYWKYAGNFPNDSFTGNTGGHGIAVDPDGKVWVQIYGVSDSITTAQGTKRATRVLNVFNPDGSPASFSPIKTVTIGGVTDTLYNSARGLRTDHEGNILASYFDTIYRINYKTGAGMNKVVPQVNPSGTQGSTETVTAPAVDNQGNMFTAQVFPEWPIRIFDKDFNLLGNAVDSSKGFSRSFEVSKDGNAIYWAGYTNHAVYKYTRPDEFSSFTVTDTLFKGFDTESMTWEPNSDNLWASAGSYSDLPNRFPGIIGTNWQPNVWYAYNTATGNIVDKIEWQFNTPGNVNERPRGLAFSPDGNTAYVTCFGASNYPIVQKFVRTPLASNFNQRGNFPNDSFTGNTGGHGIAVDPDGKVWVQIYGVSDSITTAQGTKRATRVLNVFNPDGSPASFSPIKTVTIGGVTDTLYNSARGLRTDHEGNILASYFDTIYRINYKTGAGMNKVVPQVNPSGTQGSTETVTAPAVDNQGNMFTAQVFPEWPIRIFDKDFNLLGNAVDSSKGFSRSFEVSKDGNAIYWAGYTNHAVYKYTRPDEFSSFTVTDTLFKGFDTESMTWEPNSDNLWASAGSYSDLPNRFPGIIGTNWQPNVWYAYNTATGNIVDKIEWQFNTPGNVNERPRGLAFSPDGNTAYVTCFGASNYPIIQKFVRVGTSVEGKESNWAYVETFQLHQNYPNPFNPQTTIPFDLQKTGPVQVRVYDMTGREVATLVDKVMPAGSHNLTFDAHGLATGTYYYRLMFDGQTLTKRMLYVK